MIKNNFRILKKPHANLQTILKAPVKFQKDWPKTVGGVEGTRYLLKIRNHAPCTTHHALRTTESQKQCPSAFLRKGGGQKKKSNHKNTLLGELICETHSEIKAIVMHCKIFRFYSFSNFCLLINFVSCLLCFVVFVHALHRFKRPSQRLWGAGYLGSWEKSS